MPKPAYWFKARKYGWGWSSPLTWQGWLTYAIFLLIYIGAMIYFISLQPTPDRSMIALVGLIVVTFLDVLGLLLVCYKHGESPQWCWGDKTTKGGKA